MMFKGKGEGVPMSERWASETDSVRVLSPAKEVEGHGEMIEFENDNDRADV